MNGVFPGMFPFWQQQFNLQPPNQMPNQPPPPPGQPPQQPSTSAGPAGPAGPAPGTQPGVEYYHFTCVMCFVC